MAGGCVVVVSGMEVTVCQVLNEIGVLVPEHPNLSIFLKIR